MVNVEKGGEKEKVIKWKWENEEQKVPSYWGMYNFRTNKRVSKHV